MKSHYSQINILMFPQIPHDLQIRHQSRSHPPDTRFFQLGGVACVVLDEVLWGGEVALVWRVDGTHERWYVLWMVWEENSMGGFCCCFVYVCQEFEQGCEEMGVKFSLFWTYASLAGHYAEVVVVYLELVFLTVDVWVWGVFLVNYFDANNWGGGNSLIGFSRIRVHEIVRRSTPFDYFQVIRWRFCININPLPVQDLFWFCL